MTNTSESTAWNKKCRYLANETQPREMAITGKKKKKRKADVIQPAIMQSP